MNAQFYKEISFIKVVVKKCSIVNLVSSKERKEGTEIKLNKCHQFERNFGTECTKE